MFRCLRYDINLESLSTGHNYSIMFDRCTTAADPVEPLVRCEIEYLRSRTLFPIDERG